MLFPKYLRIQDDHETAFPHILTRFDMIPSLARSRGVPGIVSSRWFARTKNGPCCFWLLFTCGRLQNPIARDRTRELELVGCDNYPQTALSAPPPGWNVASSPRTRKAGFVVARHDMRRPELLNQNLIKTRAACALCETVVQCRLKPVHTANLKSCWKLQQSNLPCAEAVTAWTAAWHSARLDTRRSMPRSFSG